MSILFGISSRELVEPIMAKRVGEAMGCVMWLWVFHRARHDGPVVLGWRHPWEHGPDLFGVSFPIIENKLMELKDKN